MSRLLYDIYIENGQPVEKSFWIAFATTLTAGIFVETGDAVTVYGWSWQDLSADFLGALSGLLIHRYHLQDTLGFSRLSGVSAMIETMPLARAAQAYARMMRGDARFRMVLTMT